MKLADSNVGDGVESWVAVPNDVDDEDDAPFGVQVVEEPVASTEAPAPPLEDITTSEDPLVAHLMKMGFEKERVQVAIGDLCKMGSKRTDADSIIGLIMGESKVSPSSSGSGNALSKDRTSNDSDGDALSENGDNDHVKNERKEGDHSVDDVTAENEIPDPSQLTLDAKDQPKDEISTKCKETDIDDECTPSGINDDMTDTTAKPSEDTLEDKTPFSKKGAGTASHDGTEPTSNDAETLPDIQDGARSSVDPSLRHHSAAYLTSALESLESMRKLNLEVEFSDAGGPPVCHEKCTHCQREALQEFLNNPPRMKQEQPTVTDAGGGINIGNLRLDGSRLRQFKSNMEEVKLDGSRLRQFKSNIEEVKLDGSRLRQFKSNMEEVKLDGRRLRRFGDNIGGFFSRSAPVDNADGGDKEIASKVTALCPPSSIGSDDTATINTTSNKTKQSTNGSKIANINSATHRRNILEKKPQPCLTCGHPTCSKHSSPTFSKNRISICQSCACLFELDHLMDEIVSTAAHPGECQRKVNHMVDCYDRAKFLLVSAAQYTDDVADALETHTVRSNRVGAGSSATGMVSGITGVVGCGALLFPPVAVAGVPILIASLVLGGGATVAQSGDAAAKYFSEPNRLAEKMVALHGMVLSLLRIAEVLSHGLLKKHLGVNYSVEGLTDGDELKKYQDSSQHKALAKEINELLEKHGVSRTTAAVGGLQSAVTSGIVATEVAAGAVTGGMRLSRVGTTAAASARFVPIAGGLLSAACVVAEGRELKKTLEKIGEGDPCAKAAQVRSIRDELDMLPDSSLIAAECQRVFELARQEKLKKKRLAENGSGTEKGSQDGEVDLSMEDVSQGDISDLIDIMETAAEVDAISE